MKKNLYSSHLLVAACSLSLAVQTAHSQWKLRVTTTMTTRTGGNVPLFIQYVDKTNLLSLYGDFNVAVADGVGVQSLNNTLTLTKNGWQNGGNVYNYINAFDIVNFHNTLFGSEYVVHTESPYIKKLNTATNTYEPYAPLNNVLNGALYVIFFQWKNYGLFAGQFTSSNGVSTLALWDTATNTMHKVGGGSLGYDFGSINSLDVSGSDSTVAFLCSKTNDAGHGLRVLNYGDSTWSTTVYPPLPANASQIVVANKSEMYVVVNSTDPYNKFASIYMLDLPNNTWKQIIRCTMANRLLYPSIGQMAYGNGALHFIPTADSCNGLNLVPFTTIHYVRSTGSLQLTSPGGLDQSCIDPGYYNIYWIGNSLYMAASGGLCALKLMASLYELPYKSALPVSFGNFTAQNAGKTNKLQWTAFGPDIHAFDIERSQDGRQFSVIESLSGKAVTGQVTYTFTDQNPALPTSYYRLKCIETDNQVTYSNIRKVDSRIVNFSVALQSNPVRAQLTLTVTTNLLAPITIAIHSLSGALLATQTNVLSPGENMVAVDVSRYAKGMYIVSVQSASSNTNLKFLKQ